MKSLLTKTMVAFTGLIGLLPATAGASTMFTFSGSSGSTSVGGASIGYTTLNYGPSNTSVTDSFVETYTYLGANSATLTFTAVSAAGPFTTAGEAFLTINETGPNLLPNTSPNAVNLYSGVTGLTFTSDFANALGIGTTTPSVASVVGAVAVTDLVVPGQVSSANAQFTVPTPSPEPASFTMLGLALLVGVAVSSRGKSKRSRSQS